jgi:hypothetical protein
MLDRAEMAHEKIVDSLKVVIPSGAVLAVVNFATINEVLNFVLLIGSIAWLFWRWNREARKKS